MAASKLAQMMTRIVAIGVLKDYKYSTEGFTKGQGNLTVVSGGQTSNVRFTIFNNEKEGAKNPHTKALDFNNQFKPGDLVYLTGQDNRSYSEAKDQYYEDIQVWDFRAANEDEINRYVYVYVGDVKELSDSELVLSFVNYKEDEMIFPIDITKTNVPSGLEVGDRIKVKGTIISGFKADFYGDGEFATDRYAVEVKVVNSKDEINAENSETPNETGLW
jgi:hypothetical protein